MTTSGLGSVFEHNTVVDCEGNGFTSKSGDTGGTVQDNIFAGIAGTYSSTSYATERNNIEDSIANLDFRSGDPLRHITVDSDAYEGAHDSDNSGWLGL